MYKFRDKQIVVLFGGVSSERAVSLLSGMEVFNALKQENLNVIKYDIDSNKEEDFYNFLIKNKDSIVIFNALHGGIGEDGTLQGLFNLLKIPYTHSGRFASTIAMNKVFTKKIAQAYDILCAKDQVLKIKNLTVENVNINIPFVVKPINEGSSKGIYLVNNTEELLNIKNKFTDLEKEVMIEEYIAGREFTVSVLEGKALAVTEIIVKKGDLYNYEAKYGENGSSHIIPANIKKDQENLMLTTSVDLYKILGCRGVVRLDFKEYNNNIFFLEINTHCGMTKYSLVPEQALYKGITFTGICMFLLENARYGD